MHDRLVFRDTSEATTAGALAADLGGRLAAAGDPLAALVVAGVLECGLADAGHPAAERSAALTDRVADAALGGAAMPSAAAVERLGVPPALALTVSPPEGFAWYALHPARYAEVAGAPELRRGPVAVVGLRSIGTTLSAALAAALRRRGVRVERRTVRPGGHPFDRRLAVDDALGGWVRRQATAGARFAVVDEGPGLSGSSLLAVAEALVAAGVARERVLVVCAHLPDPRHLLAPDAPARVARFRWRAVDASPILPADGGIDLAGGRWRSVLPGSGRPASWRAMERVKRLADGGRAVLKFEGLGPWGEAARERARRVAEAGFGPAAEPAGDGFVRYVRVPGRAARPADAGDLVPRIADYLAFRARELARTPAPVERIAEMTAHNLERVAGTRPSVRLDTVRPCVADGRLPPHEWRRGAAGVWLKTDAASHGDDHLYPGPCDVAWDLAGAVVELGLEGDGAAALLAAYRRRSGDDAGRRIGPWLLAYLAFRLGWCDLAAAQEADPLERRRLGRLGRAYRRRLDRALAGEGPAAVPAPRDARRCSSPKKSPAHANGIPAASAARRSISRSPT